MKADEKRRIEELGQLLDGTMPADDASEDVRELASLATAVHDEIEVPAPTPAFKAALRAELIEGIATSQVTLLDRIKDAIWERTARWRHSAKLLVATATASSMVGTAGVAVAAQQALPGELLYPVKQVTEDVRMGLASGLQETGHLHLIFARERLEELTDGLDGYDADTVIDLLEDMDAETVAGTNDLLRAYEETGNELILVLLERFAEQQRDGLSAIFDRIPPEASPFLDRSLELLRRIEVTVEAIADGCAVCGAAAGGDSVTLNAPGDGPAVSGSACDCVSLLPSSLARESTLDGTLSDDGSTDVSGTSGDGDLIDGDLTTTTTVPALPEPLDGAGRSLDSAITSLTGDGDSTTTGTVDDTTNTVTDTTNDTTDTVTDTTDDTTGTVDDTTEDTTGTVDDTTEDTTGTVDELLSEPTETETEILP